MTLDVVPAKAEAVAVIWIDTKPQQLAFNARASKSAFSLLIVTISKIPEQIVSPHVRIVCDGRGIPL